MNPGVSSLPLVSVVVPSYNYASYLEERIESILNQTYPNIEIIVIDDCSPDNSVEVLQKYASHPSVRLVCKDKNEGWIATNNQGAELASGEYVLFAQCDDVCDPEMIERLVEPLRKSPSAGISFCRSLLVDESGEFLGEDYAGREADFKECCKKDVLITKHQMAMFLLHSCVIPNLSAVLIRKECFDVVGGFPKDYPACADWAWFLSIAEHYGVAYVAKPLNYFMQHGETIRSLTKDKVLYEEYFRLLLSNQKKFKMSLVERSKSRLRTMELWSQHLVGPSWNGMANLPYHFSRIVSLDAVSLLYLPLALLLRMFSLFRKAIKRVLGK